MLTSRKRIFDFIDYQGIKHKDFLKKTGLKRGILDKSHIESGTTDYNLAKILEAYPNISALWLVTGKGEMLNKNENVLQKVEEPGTNYEKNSSELKMCQDYVEMQKKYIANLESQLANCRNDVNAQKNTG